VVTTAGELDTRSKNNLRTRPMWMVTSVTLHSLLISTICSEMRTSIVDLGYLCFEVVNLSPFNCNALPR